MNTLFREFEAMLINKVAQAVVSKVNYVTFETLKKMNTERMHRLYSKIFGEELFNPFAERLEMLWAIHNWMNKQIIKALEVLTNNDNPFDSADVKAESQSVMQYLTTCAVEGSGVFIKAAKKSKTVITESVIHLVRGMRLGNMSYKKIADNINAEQNLNIHHNTVRDICLYRLRFAAI